MQTPTTFAGIVGIVLDVVNVAVSGIFALLFVYLIWKITDAWVINAGDANKREEGKKTAILAVLVGVLMVGVWGVVGVLQAAIGAG